MLECDQPEARDGGVLVRYFVFLFEKFQVGRLLAMTIDFVIAIDFGKAGGRSLVEGRAERSEPFRIVAVERYITEGI